jgi:tritrans,polycis-undecaprenyl-diphosphate synthase [geranylgeranyl-diphosphate specific]
MEEVADGKLRPGEITTETIENRLYREPLREVDLIIRTGGDERTSNFLPWYANGNEAAVYFCTPYWPEFDKVEFLRAMRTYESRESSWQQTRVRRAVSLARALAETGYEDRPRVIRRLRNKLTGAETTKFDDAVDEPSEQPHPNIDLRGED